MYHPESGGLCRRRVAFTGADVPFGVSKRDSSAFRISSQRRTTAFLSRTRRSCSCAAQQSKMARASNHRKHVCWSNQQKRQRATRRTRTLRIVQRTNYLHSERRIRHFSTGSRKVFFAETRRRLLLLLTRRTTTSSSAIAAATVARAPVCCKKKTLALKLRTTTTTTTTGGRFRGRGLSRATRGGLGKRQVVFKRGRIAIVRFFKLFTQHFALQLTSLPRKATAESKRRNCTVAFLLTNAKH